MIKSLKSKFKNLNEKGQTLVEVLVAMSTAIAVLSAIAITVVSSLSNVEFTKNQNSATQYSREGLEVVRRLAKSNWETFESYNATNYCLAKSQTQLTTMGPNGCGQNVDTFVRRIDIELNSPSCQGSARVASLVSWSDSKCGLDDVFCHEVRLDSCVANINSVSFEGESEDE